MVIEKVIIDGKDVVTITAEDDKVIVRKNGGVLLCKCYTLTEDDKVSDFIEVDEGNNYKVMRRNAYPSIGDQMDIIYHDIDNGLFGANAKFSEFYKNIKAVKDKYPKDQ